jgi:hypothetical protein
LAAASTARACLPTFDESSTRVLPSGRWRIPKPDQGFGLALAGDVDQELVHGEFGGCAKPVLAVRRQDAPSRHVGAEDEDADVRVPHRGPVRTPPIKPDELVDGQRLPSTTQDDSDALIGPFQVMLRFPISPGPCSTGSPPAGPGDRHDRGAHEGRSGRGGRGQRLAAGPHVVAMTG